MNLLIPSPRSQSRHCPQCGFIRDRDVHALSVTHVGQRIGAYAARINLSVSK